MKDESTERNNCLTKSNQVLVEIIKKEWNSGWKTAISDLVKSSYNSPDICRNNLQILKELSFEIFENTK